MAGKSKVVHKAPTKREIEDFTRKAKQKRAVKEMTGSKSSKKFK